MSQQPPATPPEDPAGDATDLLDRARAWAAEDPDPVTKAELEALIVEGPSADLADRFDGTLEFGNRHDGRPGTQVTLDIPVKD